MARDIIFHKTTDWTQLNPKDNIWSELDLSSPTLNFGIHKFQNKLWSGGFVGVGRLYDKKQQPIHTEGKEHVAIIESRFGMNLWKMLEIVMSDEEYESYIEELYIAGKSLFKVFYDQPLIRLAQDTQNDGDLLYALSYVASCYILCKKGLKKTMYHREENFTSKIRGKISVKNNITLNTSRGRNDRFYCEYIDFTEDSIENQIIKATLVKCKDILTKRFIESLEISRRIAFCLNTLRKVKNVKIKTSDFSSVIVSGLYMYYKPLIQQARCIWTQKYFSYTNDAGVTLKKSVYTIPYMINMETLFEYYSRTIIKKILKNSIYTVASYSKKLFLQNAVTRIEDAERGIHLIPYCVPDILICNSFTNEPVFVIDVKYKLRSRAVHSDTHQLLSYVLLTGVKKCGFIFPSSVTKIMHMQSTEKEYLLLSVKDIKYFELELSHSENNESRTEIESLFIEGK